MTYTAQQHVSFLGLGEMGSALASAVVAAGYPTTVWNRSPGKAIDGAVRATTADEAVTHTDVVVVCLVDHASVHDVLDPLASKLTGHTVINLTTTSPDGSRELAGWARQYDIAYLDGGIMAVPDMIGTAAAEVLYSGSADVYQGALPLLETWGRAAYFGDDAGLAPLYDLALLAGMYLMFAGFFHGAAMVAAAGVSAQDFANRAVPWLQAVAGSAHEYAAVIDGGDYSVPGQQSLEFSDLTDIVDATRAQGVSTELVDAVQILIRRQIDAGFGKHGLARAFESLRGAA